MEEKSECKAIHIDVFRKGPYSNRKMTGAGFIEFVNDTVAKAFFDALEKEPVDEKTPAILNLRGRLRKLIEDATRPYGQAQTS